MRKPHVRRRAWKDPKTGAELESEFYSLDYPDPVTGRRVIRRTSPPTGDERVAKEQLRAALRGEAPGGARAVQTVAAVLQSYRKHLETEAPASLRSRGYWLTWWEERIGKLSVSEVGPDEITAAKADLKAGKGARKPGTIGGYLGVLRSAFKRGVAAGTVPAGHYVATLAITKREKSPPRESIWTDEEIAKVRAGLPPWARGLMDVLLTTGLRLGDALRLRWENVGDDRLRIVMGKGQKKLELPLFPAARTAFAAIRPEGAVGLIWPNRDGDVRTERLVMRTFDIVGARVGVLGRTRHDLRRTFAVGLRRQGIPRDLVAPFLGHGSTTMTAVYTPDEWETLTAVVDRATVAAPRPDGTSQESSGNHGDGNQS